MITKVQKMDFNDEECLLSSLCEKLLEHSDNDMDDYLVILPTQRLITCLLAMLGKKLGAFIPPQMYTLEQFLEIQKFEETSMKETISDLTLELILASLIREKNYSHISLGSEHELKQFFNDLCEHGLAEDAFKKLTELINEDVHRDEGHCENLNYRFKEINDLYKRLQNTLNVNNIDTAMGTMHSKSKQLIGQFENLETLPWKKVYIACFTTVKEFIKPLLKVMASKENCSLIFSKPPELLAKINPLQELIESVSKNAVDSEQLEQEKPPKALTKNCFVYQCNNFMGEISKALSLAKNYIAKGCPPSSIAILITQEGSYSKVLRHFIAQSEMEANLAVSTPLSQTSLGSWVLSLLGICESNQSYDQKLHVHDFLIHPIILNFLQSKDQLKENSTEDLKKEIAKAISSLNDEDVLAQLQNKIQNPILKIELIKVLSVLQSLRNMGEVTQFDKKRYPTSQWLNNLDRVFSEFGIWEQNFGEDIGVANSSITALMELMDSLFTASKLHQSFLKSEEFWKLYKERMLSLETRSIGYPLKGVQVLSLIEARYVPFQAVIILGCIEGQFPKALPKDHLIDDWFKSKIGLPAWQYVEALEDTTFQLLKNRIPRLDLCYSKEWKNELTVRSRYIEQVLIEKNALLIKSDGEEDLWNLFGAENFELYRSSYQKSLDLRAQNIGPSIKNLEEVFEHISATHLENLISCPMKFLLKKKALEEIPSLELEKLAKEGALLHKILEVFFAGNKQGSMQIEKLPRVMPLIGFNDWALKRLRMITDILLPESIDHTLPRVQLIEFSWPSFVAYLIGISKKDKEKNEIYFSKEQYCEWSIGKGQGLTLNYANLFQDKNCSLFFKIKGRIDRVEKEGATVIIWDYKRKTMPLISNVEKSLSPQLLLYALSLENDPFFSNEISVENISLMYWSVLKGKNLVPAVGKEVSLEMQTRNIAGKRTPDLSETILKLKNKWHERISELFVEKQKFIPIQGKNCLYCSYKNICRKDDPSVLKNIAIQKES